MSRRGLPALVLAAGALLLSACFTGQRPHFDDDPFPAGATTGDTAIDAVLAKLDATTSGPATAAYSLLTKFGNLTNQAEVVLDAGGRSVTIGNVRYIQTAAGEATCSVDGTIPCITGLDASRVSNIGVTVDFYAREAATRLRRDARAVIAPTKAHVETIADQAATCVDVPLAGGVAVYCALDSGLVARVDDGDVAVNLVSLGLTVDPARLVLPTL